jgi:hypothetical protein
MIKHDMQSRIQNAKKFFKENETGVRNKQKGGVHAAQT